MSSHTPIKHKPSAPRCSSNKPYNLPNPPKEYTVTPPHPMGNPPKAFNAPIVIYPTQSSPYHLNKISSPATMHPPPPMSYFQVSNPPNFYAPEAYPQTMPYPVAFPQAPLYQPAPTSMFVYAQASYQVYPGQVVQASTKTCICAIVGSCMQCQGVNWARAKCKKCRGTGYTLKTGKLCKKCLKKSKKKHH